MSQSGTEPTPSSDARTCSGNSLPAGTRPNLPVRYLVLAIVAVLAAVILGTLVTLRFEGPRPANLPTALGHDPVPLAMTNSTAEPSRNP